MRSQRRGSARVAQARGTIRPLAQQLLQRARAAGVLLEDFSDFDVPMIQFAVSYVADQMRESAPEYHKRLLTLVLDGMKAQRDGVTAMPAAPLTLEQFERGARRC